MVVAAASTAFSGHGSRTSHASSAARQPTRSLRVEAEGIGIDPSISPVAGGRACGPVGRSSGYVNPLAWAKVIRERIDQGVDYAGTGTISSIGDAKLTYVGVSGTGWPGAFIEYQLLDGPDAGCFVYNAEGINPVTGLRAGTTVRAGQTLGSIIPGWATGVELGWGAGVDTKTYAAKSGGWTAADDANDHASDAGKSFSALIGALGGPQGKVEG